MMRFISVLFVFAVVSGQAAAGDTPTPRIDPHCTYKCANQGVDYETCAYICAI